MKATITYILLIIAAFLYYGCSSSDFFYEEYKVSNPDIDLGVVPIFWEMQSFTDSVLTIIYSDSAKRYNLYPLEKINEKYHTNPVIGKITDKLTITEFNTENSGSTPNLNNVLNKNEIDLLQEAYGDADLLLHTINFGVKNQLNRTFGYGRFRLYDLNSGVLIYDVHDNFNVNLGGKEGKRNMTAYLLANSYSYFDDYVVEEIDRQLTDN